MLKNFSPIHKPKFRVLQEEQCKELFHLALHSLQRVGVRIDNVEARELLLAAGAHQKDDIIFIPANLVQDAIHKAPKSFSLFSRDQFDYIHVSVGYVNYGPGPTCTYFIDPHTGGRRKSQRGDAGYVGKVVEALDNIDYAMSLSHYHDVTPTLSPVYEFADMAMNTSKPIVTWSNSTDTLEDIYEIANIVAKEPHEMRRKPTFAWFGSYESPLHHLDQPTKNMFWAAERGIPVVYLGGPTVGIEAPFSLPSGLVIYLASVLSGLTILQLKVPGAPMVLGGVPSPMDLRTARPSYGSPEMILNVAAAAELSEYLDIPFMGTAGATESKELDLQAGVEGALQVFMSSLTGASLVHDVGFNDCADIGSLNYLIAMDEVISLVKRIMRGIEVSPETVMMDLIKKVGPGGMYLLEEQSAQRSRKEVWMPKVFDRDAYGIWEQKGKLSAKEKIQLRLEEILAVESPNLLSMGQIEKIVEVLKHAEEREARNSQNR